MQHLYFVHQVQKEVFRHLQMVEEWVWELVNSLDQWSSDLGSGLALKPQTGWVEGCCEKQLESL